MTDAQLAEIVTAEQAASAAMSAFIEAMERVADLARQADPAAGGLFRQATDRDADSIHRAAMGAKVSANGELSSRVGELYQAIHSAALTLGDEGD